MILCSSTFAASCARLDFPYVRPLSQLRVPHRRAPSTTVSRRHRPRLQVSAPRSLLTLAAVLFDGRMIVAGGAGGAGGGTLASAEVMAADGSGWAALPPMAAARYGAMAGRLPGGQVIVAGGNCNWDDEPLASAELWDPATGTWAELPPMARARDGAAGCVLPSGRFAVLGGLAGDDIGRGDAEAFDPVNRAWQPLPAMPHHLDRGAAVAVAVAGGLLAMDGRGGRGGAMLFEEESGRWFTLPNQMPTGRDGPALVTVPAP